MTRQRELSRADGDPKLESKPGDAAGRRGDGHSPASFVSGATALLWLSLATAALAQPQDDLMKRPRMNTAVPGQAPPQMIQQQTRAFYVQSAVVALLTGGAVWTVCRGSRRQ